MTEETQVTPEQEELMLLKDRADRMGIQYHPSIGLDKLRAKVKSALDLDEEPSTTTVVGNIDMSQYIETLGQKKARLKKEAEKLVRVRVTCMNPSKANMQCDTFTAGNSYIGTISRVIPFNADAWHVPQILVDMLIEKKFTHHYVIKDAKGNNVNKTKLMKEYSVVTLPNLTSEEIEELKREQALTNRLSDEA